MCQRFENKQNRFRHDRGPWAAKREFKRRMREMKGFQGNRNTPPVNVRELDDKYELFVYAAGRTKEDFQIAVADGVLILKADAQKNDTDWRRQEFAMEGFKRRFELPEGADVEQIEAKYENGVLLITLPKMEDFHTKRREVAVD
ncbi:MAG: Hsp20/alpha crystallin family protein [Saprospiraceae bacterium]